MESNTSPVWRQVTSFQLWASLNHRNEIRQTSPVCVYFYSSRLYHASYYANKGTPDFSAF